VSLAHHGVLLLDELPEFTREVLQVRRQPLEEGTRTLVRAAVTFSLPMALHPSGDENGLGGEESGCQGRTCR
jgi:predicted ATPase with chaperone activity